MDDDYYRLLGVPRDAEPEEIKRAYRQAARRWHPDANADDPEAEMRFKEVARAYEVLSDPERRARYDRFGSDEPQMVGNPFGGGLGDIFDAFFGGAGPFGGGAGGGRRGPMGPPAGPDLEVATTLEFEQAVFGTQHEVRVKTAVPCESCEATGSASGSNPVICGDCDGAGQVRVVRQSLLGQMVTASPCRRCGGQGMTIEKPCLVCQGEGRNIAERTYTVDIPAGVDTGATLRLTGKGAVGPRGGPHGDLYVKIRVAPHDTFERQGFDLVRRLGISVSQAALGAHMELETLDGTEDLLIPRGTQSGRVFRLRGRGVPVLNGRGRGELLVEVVVETPTDLSAEEEELLRSLAELRGEEVAPEDAGFFSRIRSAFR